MAGTRDQPHGIGLDAGGAKTVGLPADGVGRMLRDARTAGANLTMEGELRVEKVLFQVIEPLEPLDPPRPVSVLCLGIAGAGAISTEVLCHPARECSRRPGLVA